MIDLVISNWVCWAIVAIALICYQQLWMQWLSTSYSHNMSDDANSEEHAPFALILIGTMPLLGLLGTIIGLLDCFDNMARGDIDAALISGGISDALITTQFGLACAVPGWLLYGFVNSKSPRKLLIKGQ